MKKILLILISVLLIVSFASCDIEDEATKYAKNGLEYAINEDKETCTIVGLGKCTDTEVTVPDKIGKYQVSVIGEEAFCAGRFTACENLTKVVLPEGLLAIKTGAFAGAKKLTTVNIPSTVTEIGEHAFEYCENLNGITLPQGLKEIGAQVFLGCVALDSINIPDGVTKIGAAAFHGCEKLDSISLPESVTEIGESAFATSGIKYARVGAKLQRIGQMAFSLCDSFESFYFEGTLSQWESVTCDGGWSDGIGTFHCIDTEFPMSNFYE